MLVDGGPSGPFFDDRLHPVLKDNPRYYKELDWPHKTVTAGRRFLLGAATGTASEAIVGANGHKYRVTCRDYVYLGWDIIYFQHRRWLKLGLSPASTVVRVWIKDKIPCHYYYTAS